MNIIYRDSEHEAMFLEICGLIENLDCYHLAVAYLLTLDVVLSEHVPDVFDLTHDCIVPDGLTKGWQTGTSKNTTRLLFNLWNNYTADFIPEEERDEDFSDKTSYYSVSEIFCCPYAPYYWQAVKLRYPEYTGDGRCKR